MVAIGTEPRAPKKGRRLWRWLKMLLVGVGALLAVLVTAGGIYQTISANQDAKRFHPPGRLVSLGGYSLHLLCTGDSNADDYTVVLESGAGGTTSSWVRIQNAVAEFARVCSYDRGGIGWSDPSPEPRDALSIAMELHELLNRGGVRGRLILVGHSSGGVYVRAFQRLYPERVAGLALLDASHEEQFTRTQQGRSAYRMIKNAYRISSFVARFGLARLTAICDLADLPEPQRAEFHAVCSRPSYWAAQAREVEALQAGMDQIRDKPGLDSLPLIVITAGNDPQNLENWPELQDELAGLSTASVHMVRSSATHPGLVTDPNEAKVVSDAIATLLASLR